MHKRFAEDVELHDYNRGFQRMLEDALDGHFPVLPCVRIPEDLGHEKLMEITADAQSLQIKKVLQGAESDGFTQEAIDQAYADALDESLSSRSLSPSDGGREIYYSALAACCRDAGFAAKQSKLEDAHRKRLRQAVLSHLKP